jgi:biopolymer transport protein ExbD
MGYDERHQSSSSGPIVAIVVAGVLFAILAIIAVAAVGLFWVRTDVVQMQSVATEQRLVAEVQLKEAEAQRAITQQAVTRVQIKDGIVQIQESSSATTPDPKLDFVLEIDREGNTSVDDEKFDLDELRARLAKLKDETSDTYSVGINVDPECPVKYVIPVLDVCDEVGGIDYRIVGSTSR